MSAALDIEVNLIAERLDALTAHAIATYDSHRDDDELEEDCGEENLSKVQFVAAYLSAAAQFAQVAAYRERTARQTGLGVLKT